ncbi:hypothetical protein ASPWEDRAFT_44375 [Aspergillus wentii DTO 134E9]|uniref:Rhodopsin domain-containing protein n=1 Tax=Aspergillus wentii DTO 134E9 TaxID=1073089 RepID=A0A1L9RBN9_ASPWE|nr:uncharacterized protein ASPWEDRAFT_44375 [Aspergillus wentii DTO 134E9]OJJ32283.1 hypothetical protein ASPWEDRAFT_44375 [Aspergillus wentii DTO 134E9]
MSQEPAAPPPPNIIPNFSNPSGGFQIWVKVTQFICIPVVACVVIMRLYVKIFMQHVFFVEDWMCLISWILATTWFSLQLLSAYAGGGNHQWDIPKDNMVLFLKASYIINVIYSPLILTVKLSILFMLARFFAPYPVPVYFIYIFSGVLVAYTIAATVVKIRICMPISAFWQGTEATSGACLHVLKVFLSDTIFSVITDLVILALPIILIPLLHLPLMKKFKIVLILAAGGIVCVVTIVRLVWVIMYQNSTDTTWTSKRTDLVTCAEITLGIICACLPAGNFLASQVSIRSRLRLSSLATTC